MSRSSTAIASLCRIENGAREAAYAPRQRLDRSLRRDRGSRTSLALPTRNTRRRSGRVRRARAHELPALAERARGQRHARSCSSHSICSISTAGTCTASRCASARNCCANCSNARQKRFATASTSKQDGVAFLPRGVPPGARGRRREARFRSVSRGAHEELAQGEVPAAPGVRHRRLYRSERLADGLGCAVARHAQEPGRAAALCR